MYGRIRSALATLAAQAPTVLILVALAGLAYWGARNDWKLPRPAAEKEKEAPREGGEVASQALPTVKLDSPEAMEKAGIRWAAAEERHVTEYVRANAELDFNLNRIAHLSSRAPGTVWSVVKQEGDRVKRGDVLAVVASSQVATLKFDFQQTLLQVETRAKILERMQATPSIPDQTVREAERALREARIRLYNDQQSLLNLGLPLRLEDFEGLSDEEAARRLRFLGVPDAILERVREIDPSRLTANLLPLRSPFDGLVIKRDMVVGEVIGSAPEKWQFIVADMSTVWVTLYVRLEDVGRVSLGQKVIFTPEGGGDEEAPPGPLTWMSAEVDEKSHTVSARAVVPNPDGRLRPHTFGKARVLIREDPRAVVIPDTAVQRDVGSPLVFVRLTAGDVRPRPVLLGARDGKYIEVLDPAPVVAATGAGLAASPLGFAPLLAAGALPAERALFAPILPGDDVATSGSFILKSEMLKDRIGGGED
jgi:cobalt-zinc-cadmium efflux system membrane fusion protein